MTKQITTLNVPGMSCSHCENSVRKAVGSLEGVSGIAVSLAEKKVTVEYSPEQVDLKAIKEAIEDQGYDVK